MNINRYLSLSSAHPRCNLNRVSLGSNLVSCSLNTHCLNPVRCSGRHSRLGSNPHNRGKNSSLDRYGHSALSRNNGKW
ncbi:hypothetical protein [Syntrophus aciditrophicus]|uniref:hypothetical protein n=1 Tax=Syntrophus aciditrophicus TaxID=316277 RepID=UPI0011D07FEC|nr:hypothetical protein [Syntrophus aciditrophicus]